VLFPLIFDVHVTVYLNTHLSNFAILVAVLLLYDFWVENVSKRGKLIII
jgi:hypothetical protein